MKKIKLSNKVRAIIWIAVTITTIVVTLYALYSNAEVKGIMPLVGAIGLLGVVVGGTMLYETEFDEIHDRIQTLIDENMQLLNILRRRENENHDTIDQLYDAARINDSIERLKVANKIAEEDIEKMNKLTEELSKL